MVVVAGAEGVLREEGCRDAAGSGDEDPEGRGRVPHPALYRLGAVGAGRRGGRQCGRRQAGRGRRGGGGGRDVRGSG